MPPQGRSHWRPLGGVLAVPDFRRLWLVGLAVSVARWLEMLVIGVVVWSATHSAFLVAAMTLLRLAPMGLLGAPLGVLADRIERRAALIAVLVVQASGMAALAAVAAAGDLAVWHIALACLASGLGWAADNPVRRMMIGDSLGAARMGVGMSLDVVGNNASRVAGPALGGTLLAALGPEAAFGAAFLLYLAAIAIATRLSRRPRTMAPRTGPVLAEVRESFHLAAALPRLRAVLIVTVVFNLFAWPFTAMVPVIAAEHLRLGPEATGWLASLDGVGALAGAALVGLLTRPAHYPYLLVAGAALYLAMVAGFSATQATLVYQVTPPELRSRALGVLSVAVGSGLIGFLHLGLLAGVTGPRIATMMIGLEGLLALALTWRWWRAVLAPLDKW